MIKDKKLLYLLLVLAVILTSACQREEQTAVNDTNAEKEVVLSTHISNKKVNGICEDQYGQIWIGTFRGLNKYDGTKYHQYFCVDDSLGLPDNQISSIYKDSRNRLWVTTVNGICFYNKKVNLPGCPSPKEINIIPRSLKIRKDDYSLPQVLHYINMMKREINLLSN